MICYFCYMWNLDKTCLVILVRPLFKVTYFVSCRFYLKIFFPYYYWEFSKFKPNFNNYGHVWVILFFFKKIKLMITIFSYSPSFLHHYLLSKHLIFKNQVEILKSKEIFFENLILFLKFCLEFKCIFKEMLKTDKNKKLCRNKCSIPKITEHKMVLKACFWLSNLVIN